ncbi:MAG: hypothetical protein HN778_15990 [Prolixibacteraceae bacterium]|jgi:hypothetical protein|nr:hypothetical protein [Prolixibacteraceae bacterium]MBT6007291.1 hypothetical protein [Prolixibacteraceae bacterium]MBT6765144.1 hypothetical protein [Prolixibacteraceae bacterium]MBT7396330.1 hypothetical protein [Prolixibacteraceae bacterium]
MNNYFVMICSYLMQKYFQGVVNELPNLEKYGYERIPKNIEEAVVAYKLLNIGSLPELNTLKINPQTEQRFKLFIKFFSKINWVKNRRRGPFQATTPILFGTMFFLIKPVSILLNGKINMKDNYKEFN